MINKLENISRKTEKSFEYCNNHYSGIAKVYEEFIALLSAGTNIDLLINQLKNNLPEIKADDAFSHGIADGLKRIETVIACLKSGELTKAEVKDILDSELERMPR